MFSYLETFLLRSKILGERIWLVKLKFYANQLIGCTELEGEDLGRETYAVSKDSFGS